MSTILTFDINPSTDFRSVVRQLAEAVPECVKHLFEDAVGTEVKSSVSRYKYLISDPAELRDIALLCTDLVEPSTSEFDAKQEEEACVQILSDAGYQCFKIEKTDDPDYEWSVLMPEADRYLLRYSGINAGSVMKLQPQNDNDPDTWGMIFGDGKTDVKFYTLEAAKSACLTAAKRLAKIGSQICSDIAAVPVNAGARDSMSVAEYARSRANPDDTYGVDGFMWVDAPQVRSSHGKCRLGDLELHYKKQPTGMAVRRLFTDPENEFESAYDWFVYSELRNSTEKWTDIEDAKQSLISHYKNSVLNRKANQPVNAGA